MPVRRKRRLPLALRRKLSVLEVVLSQRGVRPLAVGDREAVLALLAEYARDGEPKVLSTESGRCYICSFRASWIREAVPGVGLTRRNKILLCRHHQDELEGLLAAEKACGTT